MSIRLDTLVRQLETLVPLHLAEDWDNVGLLVEPPSVRPVQRALLCIDLTEAVVAEARQMRVQLILAYHPIIFGGLSRITQAVPIQRVVSAALCAGIAVYSPHTALDCMVGGVNDWLAQGLGKGTVRCIQPRASVDGDETPADPRLGQGRVLELDKPTSIQALLRRIKKHLALKHLRIAMSDRHAAGEEVGRILLCAGAGGSVVAGQSGDLILTGEMSHHDVLAHREAGASVVLTEHSNTERGYLPLFREHLELHVGSKVRFLLSEVDRDPLTIV
jgi:dinuclear metal center YbgI/SA1388 family protein